MTERTISLFVDSTFASPYAMSAYVALTEKAIPFKVATLNLEKNEHFNADYFRSSLTRRVPMLSHDNFYLSESSAISEYLEEAFPPPKFARVYPSNMRERARARQIQAWLRSDFMPIREERSTAVIFFNPTDKALSQTARGWNWRLRMCWTMRCVSHRRQARLRSARHCAGRPRSRTSPVATW